MVGVVFSVTGYLHPAAYTDATTSDIVSILSVSRNSGFSRMLNNYNVITAQPSVRKR